VNHHAAATRRVQHATTVPKIPDFVMIGGRRVLNTEPRTWACPCGQINLLGWSTCCACRNGASLGRTRSSGFTVVEYWW